MPRDHERIAGAIASERGCRCARNPIAVGPWGDGRYAQIVPIRVFDDFLDFDIADEMLAAVGGLLETVFDTKVVAHIVEAMQKR